jgi:putative transcriptional regulator
MQAMVNVTPEWIKQLRLRLGLNQAQFGKKVGVAQNTVAQWENGQTRPRGSAQIILEMIFHEAERIAPEKISA